MRFLKIFSWFLLTFGIVGFGATMLGIDLGIGTGPHALGALAMQVVVAALIFWGFKLEAAGKLDRKILTYGGWLLLVSFIVGAQILVIAGEGDSPDSTRSSKIENLTGRTNSVRVEPRDSKWILIATRNVE